MIKSPPFDVVDAAVMHIAKRKEMELRLSGRRQSKEDHRKVTRRKWLCVPFATSTVSTWSTSILMNPISHTRILCQGQEWILYLLERFTATVMEGRYALAAMAMHEQYQRNENDSTVLKQGQAH